MPAPNFFLVGAPKCGTTALFKYLEQHPQIYVSPVKEPNFLADELRLENFSEEMRRRAEPKKAALQEYLRGPMNGEVFGGLVSDRSDYFRLFQHVKDEIAIGEASVCYLWSKTAPYHIAAEFPDARILMVLRDPADRAFSQYLHMLTYAKSHRSFREYLDASLSSASTQISELYPFLEFGRYQEQVKRYLDLFPREQIGIYFYQDFVRDPAGFLQEVFRFLGVNPNLTPDLSRRHMEARVPRSFILLQSPLGMRIRPALRTLVPPALRGFARRVLFRPRGSLTMSAADRAFLIDLYRDDIVNLSHLLDRDLSPWLH